MSVLSVNKFTTQLPDSTEFIRVGTVWLSSCTSLKEFHVWDLPTVSTVHHPCSGTKVICLSLYKVYFLAPKTCGIIKDVGEN